MKYARLLAALFVALLFILFFAGSCDQTDLEGKGSIRASAVKVTDKDTVDLTLELDPEFKDTVSHITWTVIPPENATIVYKRNTAIGEESLSYKEDRKASLLLYKKGTCTVTAYGIYEKKAMSEPIAELDISVE